MFLQKNTIYTDILDFQKKMIDWSVKTTIVTLISTRGTELFSFPRSSNNTKRFDWDQLTHHAMSIIEWCVGNRVSLHYGRHYPAIYGIQRKSQILADCLRQRVMLFELFGSLCLPLLRIQREVEKSTLITIFINIIYIIYIVICWNYCHLNIVDIVNHRPTPLLLLSLNDNTTVIR